MPEPLFQKDIRMKRVTTLGHSAAQALNDPVRIKILEILSHKQMSAEEIAKALGGSGYKKATTTVRHHLDTLKGVGLVETTKMVEVRGAVLKYYAPTLRAFGHEAPADFDSKHSKLVEDVSGKLLKIMKGIMEDKKFVAALEAKQCSICKNDHYKEFLALEILNAGIARAMEKKEYAELAGGKEQAKK
jgi:DNA-binding transcriptional ArsR family regulator